MTRFKDLKIGAIFYFSAPTNFSRDVKFVKTSARKYRRLGKFKDGGPIMYEVGTINVGVNETTDD